MTETAVAESAAEPEIAAAAEAVAAVRAPIEFRAAATLDVRYPERIVSVLAMPYEVETNRVLRGGAPIAEVVSRGAFGRIEHRKDVRVYRSHAKDSPTGRAIALYPDDERGLVADLRIARTPLGDETLELAADHLLDASVGFAPIAESWSADRQRRRLDRCYLDHVALLGDPAYETASVLEVRGGERTDAWGDLRASLLAALAPPTAPPTPRKDEILARLAEIGYHRPLT